jgi:hypothetical protein
MSQKRGYARLATRYGDMRGCMRGRATLFEGECTTSSDYVLAQRLLRAHRLLTNPHCAGQKFLAVL